VCGSVTGVQPTNCSPAELDPVRQLHTVELYIGKRLPGQKKSAFMKQLSAALLPQLYMQN